MEKLTSNQPPPEMSDPLPDLSPADSSATATA
jgi:hypothetical protein